MSGNEKREFGDYQTPVEFCDRVCDYLINNNIVQSPIAILEPTCGVGNFIKSAHNKFCCDNIFGVDINSEYAKEAQRTTPVAKIYVGNIFDINTREMCQTDDILVIGNPPWATNADLENNLPQKTNFKGLRGIDALTGSSNFDICEYIILQMIEQYRGTNSTICMLCKTSVARNVVLEISRNKIAYQTVQMLIFNSSKVFGVSAAACVFIVKLSSEETDNDRVMCEVKNFDTLKSQDCLIVSSGIIKSSAVTSDLEGKCQLIWRQGVKHDCGKIMELDFVEGGFANKLGSVVHIEGDLVFPLVKSSHFKTPVISEFAKYVIVTQRKPKEDTSYIAGLFPRTWRYLQDHVEYFRRRKSTIYTNAPQFSMFGIGEYSFAPYKVGLSGFYKKPLFALLYSNKPVMTDDTAYFLPFYDYDLAYCMMLLLNSEVVQQFLMSIAFLDNKRPYTVKVLSRLDLKKCISVVSFDAIKETEMALELEPYITNDHYQRLASYLNEQQFLY